MNPQRELKFSMLRYRNIDQSPFMSQCEQFPTDIDIKKALKRLKNKAPGDSGTTPLMLKASIHDNISLYFVMLSFKSWTMNFSLNPALQNNFG